MALNWYADPEVLRFSEGGADPYDRDQIKAMYEALSRKGEHYVIEIKAIQELLGHASIVMTMRYAHLAPEVRRDAVLLPDRGSIGQQVGSNGRLQA